MVRLQDKELKLGCKQWFWIFVMLFKILSIIIGFYLIDYELWRQRFKVYCVKFKNLFCISDSIGQNGMDSDFNNFL